MKLSQNLLSTILLAKKGVEVIFNKFEQLFKIVIDKDIFGLVNIIENQYVIQLAKTSKFAIFNQITTPTIET